MMVKDHIGCLSIANRSNNGNFIYNLSMLKNTILLYLKYILIAFCFFGRYEILHVSETLPQMVALSEAYMRIYEQQR